MRYSYALEFIRKMYPIIIEASFGEIIDSNVAHLLCTFESLYTSITNKNEILVYHQLTSMLLNVKLKRKHSAFVI